MSKVEKEALLAGSEDSSSVLTKVKSHAYLLAVMILMGCCLCFIGLVVGFNAAELAQMKKYRDSAELGYTTVDAFIAVGNELASRTSGGATVSALDRTVETLASSWLLEPADRNGLRSLLLAARSSTTASELRSAYESILWTLDRFALDALAQASDPSSRSELGLLCLANSMQRFGNPRILLNDFAAHQWDVEMLQLFAGSQSFEQDCDLLIPEAQWGTTYSLTLPQKSVSGVPNPHVLSLTSAITTQETKLRANLVQQLTVRLLQESKDQYNDEVRTVTLSLAFACVAAAIVIALMIFAPILSRGSDGSKSDIRSIFRDIEATVKLLNRYTTVLTTCSARDGDAAIGFVVADARKDSQGNFLNKIIDFVRDIRPYVPQSSFGDIENVPITGQLTTTKSSVQIDSTSAAQAIRELRLRDLRPDMGMQIVSGTVMVLSLSSFHREPDAVGGEALRQEAVRDRLSGLIQQIEACVNGTTGVVHTIAGDSIVALWNVTSSTPVPQVCAVSSALQLVKTLQGSDMNLSVGIAQSFLLAGNIEMSSRKVLAISGPAVALADRLEGCNAAHRTSIMIDTACADAVQTAVIPDFDFTVRPVVLLRLKDDADDFVTGYAVYPHRVRQDKLKAWNAIFKELGGKLQSGALADALLDIEEFKGKYGADGGAKGKASTAKGSGGVDRTAESWKRNLMATIRIKESSLRNANNATQFGV